MNRQAHLPRLEYDRESGLVVARVLMVARGYFEIRCPFCREIHRHNTASGYGPRLSHCINAPAQLYTVLPAYLGIGPTPAESAMALAYRRASRGE